MFAVVIIFFFFFGLETLRTIQGNFNKYLKTIDLQDFYIIALFGIIVNIIEEFEVVSFY